MRKPQSWGKMGPIDRGGEGKRRVRGEDSETTFWGQEGSETLILNEGRLDTH